MWAHFLINVFNQYVRKIKEAKNSCFGTFEDDRDDWQHGVTQHSAMF